MTPRVGFVGLSKQLLGACAQLLRRPARLLEPLLHQLNEPLIFLGDVGPWTDRCHACSLRPTPAGRLRIIKSYYTADGDIAYIHVRSPQGCVCSKEERWGLRDLDESGALVGIELWSASTVLPADRIGPRP